MSIQRLPRKLLTSYITEPRLANRHQVSWAESLNNALTAKGIPVEFGKWKKLAADRAKWKELLLTVADVTSVFD
jgi:hypothetical protein